MALGRRSWTGLPAIALVLLARPAAPLPVMAAPPGLPTPYFASDNVKFIENIPSAADGVGGRVVGNYLYMTSSKDLEIYDISAPTNPVLVGTYNVEVEWENEQLPTNGKILGVSSSIGCQQDPTQQTCLAVYDVTDKANPKVVATTGGVGDHTQTCLLDCQFMWGSSGHVTDIRHVTLDGKAPLIGNWLAGLPATSAHNQTEVAPGIVLTATNPIMLLSVRPEDGGSVVKPHLLATGRTGDSRFIHGTQWPNHGTDRFALVGGEDNNAFNCSQFTPAVFMTFDASHAYSTGKFTMIDQYVMTDGTYTDGNPAVSPNGCSVHWFEEQRDFHNGGLVAVAAYDHGTRFLRVDAAGKISQVGYFEIPAGAASAAHWAPDGRTLYVIDYQRGLDVIQWTGPTYVPGQAAAATPAAPAPTASPAAQVAPPAAGGGALPSTAPAPVPPLVGTGAGALGAVLAALLVGRRHTRRKAPTA